MPKKINKKKQSKTKKTKNKKVPQKEITKKKTSKKKILAEAWKDKLKRSKKTEEKIEKIKNELKKFFGRFSLRETAILVGEMAVIIIFLALIAALLFSGNLFRRSQKTVPAPAVPTAGSSRPIQAKNNNANLDNGQQEEYAAAQKTDSSNWATYTNKYYGFGLKYPPDWNKVVAKSPVRGSKWTVRYQFRKKNQEEGNPYAGFDLTVYNVKTVKEIKNTEEFPAIKDGVDPNAESCQTIPGHLEENPDYPNEEIFIPSGDDCYSPALFYTITRDDYVYNVSLVYAEGFDKSGNPKKQALEKFPEFFEAAISLKLINIVRLKPQPVAPKITAPRPVSAKKVNGRLVCAKKNDHPRKSKQHKGKHLDMECCLDPDEYPNPWCTY